MLLPSYSIIALLTSCCCLRYVASSASCCYIISFHRIVSITSLYRIIMSLHRMPVYYTTPSCRYLHCLRCLLHLHRHAIIMLAMASKQRDDGNAWHYHMENQNVVNNALCWHMDIFSHCQHHYLCVKNQTRQMENISCCCLENTRDFAKGAEENFLMSQCCSIERRGKSYQC